MRFDMKNDVNNDEMNGAGVAESRKTGGVADFFARHFTAKRIAAMAVFTALALAISFASFPIFPASPVFFLELDFGNVFILFISFLLGPMEGVIVCVLKETLHIVVAIRHTNAVGELANILMTSAYILLPSIVYQVRKGIKPVILSLAAACLIGTAAALVVNRCITFPLYMGWEIGGEVFYGNLWLIVAFNLIKTVAISVLTILLYKRLSNFFKKWKI